MKTQAFSARRTMMEGLTVLVRWLLGATFFYLGLNKVVHPVEFLKLLRQYDLVSTPLFLNALAALLPWFEVFCGLLLLAGVAVRGTAATLLAMLVSFTLLVFHRAWLLQAIQGIPFCAVKFDCGCGQGEVWVCRKLTENLLLVLFAAWLLAGRGRKFCARYSLMPTPKKSASADSLGRSGSARTDARKFRLPW